MKHNIVATHNWMSLCAGYRNQPYIFIGHGGVFIIPVNEACEVLFIMEPTVFDNQRVMYVPAGTVEEGEPAAETANRELQEEIGYRAGRMDFLYEFHPLARHGMFSDIAYLARDLTPSKLESPEPYDFPVERVPLSDFELLLISGRLRDSTIIAALYMARDFIANEST